MNPESPQQAAGGPGPATPTPQNPVPQNTVPTPPAPTPPITPPQPQQPLPPQPPLQQPPAPVPPQATPSTEQPGQESVKTLGLLHRHERGVGLIVIIFTIGLIAANLAGGAHVLAARKHNYNSQPWVKAVLAQKHFGPTVIDRSDGTLDMSKQVDGLLTTSNQDLKAGLNQQVNVANGISFMVTGIQKNWHSQNSYALPAPAGEYYIKIDMVFGNRNTSAQKFYLFDLSANSNGQRLDNILYFPDGSSEFANHDVSLANYSSELDPGKTVKGALVIHVPVNTVPKLTFHYTGIGHAKPDADGQHSIDDYNMNTEVSLQ